MVDLYITAPISSLAYTRPTTSLGIFIDVIKRALRSIRSNKSVRCIHVFYDDEATY